jgi:hypothetical protein
MTDDKDEFWDASCAAGFGTEVLWDPDYVTQTADEVLAPGSGGDGGSAKEDAIDFLRIVLADGPVPAADIERQARSAGLLGERQPISQCKPIRAARNALGIEPRKLGMGQGRVWSLPKVPSGPEGALQNERAPSGEKGTFGAVSPGTERGDAQ